MEIYKGLLDPSDAKEHALVLFKNYDKEHPYLGNDSRSDLEASERLKDKIRTSGLAPENIYEYISGEVGYEQKVLEFLEQVIDKEILNLNRLEQWEEALSVLEGELETVEKNYLSDDELLSEFDGFLAENNGRVVLCEGKSGVGKSYFLKYWYKNHINRAAAFFTDIYPYTRSILNAFGFCFKCLRKNGILVLEDGDDPECLPGYKESRDRLIKYFGQIQKDKEVVFVIDCVEDISDWAKLPFNIFNELPLPGNVTVIICCRGRKSLGPDNKFVGKSFVISPIKREDSVEILRQKLLGKGRLLTDTQWTRLYDFLPSSCTRLYLQILSRYCEKWTSEDDYMPILAEETLASQDSVIRAWLSQFGARKYPLLHRNTLAYLAFSKDGLTENEILDLLTRDKEVVSEIIDETTKTSRVNWQWDRRVSIPPVLWANVYYEIKENITEIFQRENLLINFRHSAFSEQVCFMLTEEEKEKILLHMRSYFEGNEWYHTNSDGEIQANLRKVRELYNLNYLLQDEKGLKNLLENPMYADCSIRLGMYADVVAQLFDFVPVSDKIEKIWALLCQKSIFIQTFCDCYMQLAAEAGIEDARILEKIGGKYFFETNISADNVFTMSIPGAEFAVNDEGILAVLTGGTIWLYDMRKHIALDIFCHVGSDMGTLYWKGNLLTFRGEYVRIRYLFGGKQLREISREDCVSQTLLARCDKKLKGADWDEVKYFCEPNLYEKQLHYFDGTKIKHVVAPPLNIRRHLLMKNYNSILAVAEDGVELTVYDLERKLCLLKYDFLMIENMRFSESGKEILLITPDGKVALAPIQGKEEPMRGTYADKKIWNYIWDIINNADGMSIMFSAISLPHKGDYPVEKFGQVNGTREPMFAAFSSKENWIAVYYRYAGESIVRLFTYDTRQLLRTFLTHPICQKDSLSEPFYSSGDGKELVLMSGGVAHIYNIKTDKWTIRKDWKSFEDNEIFDALNEKYKNMISRWQPQPLIDTTIQPQRKKIKDKLFDSVYVCFERVMKHVCGLNNRIAAERDYCVLLKEKKCASIQQKADLLWLVDYKNGIVRVYDKNQEYLCGTQVSDKILAYETTGNMIKVLVGGNLNEEVLILHRL
ncbi:MAG: hypothetical protein LUG52_00330 [Clostridia bacterium]|nr:hypothetical protein [Clostridia bacterium]